MVRIALYITFILLSINASAQQDSCTQNASAEEFQFFIDSCSNEIIIDVRPTDMFKNKIIPNALFVPTISDLNLFADTLDKETPVLVYCTIGVRSAKVCELLCEKNFHFVVNLKDGIERWKKEGFEVIKSEN